MKFPVGTVQTATVVRETNEYYIVSRDSKELMLHNDDQDEALSIGETIDVFIFNDRKNEVVATTTIPTIQKDTYGWANVVEVIPRLGAFVDIGIPRDILISVDDLPLYDKVWPKIDDGLYVTLDEDQEGRLLAKPANEQIFMDMREIATDDVFNTEIVGQVYYTSREGAAIFTQDGYRGFVHHSEREQEPRLGELIKGRIIDVKDDGTVNISLLPLKQDRLADDAQVILEILKENNGEIPFSDKSDPEAIRNTFGFSKSAFKRALGRLMREKKVEQHDGNTYLISAD